MSDRGIPRSLRMMQGFGVHTFRLVNGTAAILTVPGEVCHRTDEGPGCADTEARPEFNTENLA